MLLKIIEKKKIKISHGRGNMVFIYDQEINKKLSNICIEDFISHATQNNRKKIKISHGRGNSLKNKVRSWVKLKNLKTDPLKPLPTHQNARTDIRSAL